MCTYALNVLLLCLPIYIYILCVYNNTLYLIKKVRHCTLIVVRSYGRSNARFQKSQIRSRSQKHFEQRGGRRPVHGASSVVVVGPTSSNAFRDKTRCVRDDLTQQIPFDVQDPREGNSKQVLRRRDVETAEHTINFRELTPE